MGSPGGKPSSHRVGFVPELAGLLLRALCFLRVPLAPRRHSCTLVHPVLCSLRSFLRVSATPRQIHSLLGSGFARSGASLLCPLNCRIPCWGIAPARRKRRRAGIAARIPATPPAGPSCLAYPANDRPSDRGAPGLRRRTSPGRRSHPAAALGTD